MAKLGNDWLFIGLGIGAIYLVSRLGKPVEDVGGDIARVTDSAAGLLQTTLGLVDTSLQGYGLFAKNLASTAGSVATNYSPNSSLIYPNYVLTRNIQVSGLQSASVFSSGSANSQSLNYVLNKSSTPFKAPSPQVTAPKTNTKSVVFDKSQMSSSTTKKMTTQDFAKLLGKK